MDKTLVDLAQLFSNAKERALPAGQSDIALMAGEALITHDEYSIHKELPLQYKFEDVASFAAYAKADIDEAVGMIFYADTGLVGLHSRIQPTGNRIHYDFELSPELLAWKHARNYSHKMFRKFLEERLDELVDVTIFQTLATLKMNTSIHFESDFDDDRNYGFIYQEKEAKGFSKIPKEFTINVPFFTNDPPQEINLRLSVSQPKDPDSKPLFIIEIIREERLLADNVARGISAQGSARRGKFLI